MKRVTLTKLRADLYNIVDQILETGVPVEIERNSERLKIVPCAKKSKLKNLKKHPGTIIGDPNKLVHMNWTKYWNKDI